MNRPHPAPSLVPARVQPLLAAIVGCALVAMAAWYVASGGLAGGLVTTTPRPPPRCGSP